ncbi:MAG TPA: hypothetical protein VG501_00960 [Rhizomicrobium sp.]|nr:hypothetical protein [Rhizomicrobium sp.]
MFTPRLDRRLIRHHLPLSLASLICAIALYVTRPYPDVISRLSFATAYPALVLLAATLAIGPVKYLAGERLAVSLDLRRDVGIWAGILGLLHTGVGQCVHLRGRPWLYYIYDATREKHVFPIRHDMFGFANFTGLAAALILLALLATSNDASLRKLGTPGWKQLQRWNYYCFGLTALHTFAYQRGVESQNWPFLATAVAPVAIVLVLQFLGWRRRGDLALKPS